MCHRVSKSIGGRELSLESGKVAKQADGAVRVRYGGTEVLVTAVRGGSREDIDFLPLITDYREMAYAAGKFPGGFFKREGKPTTKETLTMRLMDRPIRPLFPENYTDEVEVMALVLSADRENDPDILAVVGASASLFVSPIPFNDPVGAVRVGMVDGEFVVNPTVSQVKEGALSIVVAVTEKGLVMVEGSAKEVPEETVLRAIEFAVPHAMEVVQMQKELYSMLGVEKLPVPPVDEAIEELYSKISAEYRHEFEERNYVKGKKARSKAIEELVDRIVEAHAGGDEEMEKKVRRVCRKIEEEVVRRGILEGKRPDGRAAEDLREITCEVGLLPMTHGSALFTRGETQALVVVTLGTAEDEQKIDGLEEEYYKSFLVHYNFPPFSVGEVKPPRPPGRREIGHGNLAERALEAVMPPKEEFPYTVRVVSDILESNGSSSMASVCGGSLALMDAGVPIRRAVAGIALGMVSDGDKKVFLTDIAGAEDHCGDMDLKVAGTSEGITALQMDIKVSSVDTAVLERLFSQAKDARMKVLEKMLAVLPAPRESLSPNAPKLRQLKIEPEMIGTLIGPSGKVVRALQNDTGTKIEILEDGTVLVSGDDFESVDEAVRRIESIVLQIEVGDVFQAKVVSVKEGFGAFVELVPGREALLHISEISDAYIEKVGDYLQVGDTVRVKVVNIDDEGKVRVSMRAIGEEPPRKPKWTRPRGEERSRQRPSSRERRERR